MDPTALAGAVVAMVAPYLAEAGKAAAEKAGESAASHVGGILGVIRRKFGADDDEYAQQTLARLEEQPQAEARRRSLADLLAEKLEAEPAFREELERLVQGARRDTQTMQFLTQVYGGQVGEVFNIGSVQTLNVGRQGSEQ